MLVDDSLADREGRPGGVGIIRHFVVSPLVARADTLARWREQVPTLSGHTKNFENWLLVELVGLVAAHGRLAKVRTNGYVDKTYEPSNGRRVQQYLHGRKRASDTISPDLSVQWNDGSAVHCELKTAISAIDVIGDLIIIRDYNENDATDRSTARLVWAVLLPKGDAARVSKSLDRICKRAKSDVPLECDLPFEDVLE